MTPAEGKRPATRRASRPRLALYAGVLAVGAPVSQWASTPPRPRAAALAAVEALRADEGAPLARADTATLLAIPGRGWTLSVWAGNDAAFDADFLVVRRIDDGLQVDLLRDVAPDPRGGGELPERRLTGAEALAYLARVGIDPTPIDALVHRRFPLARAEARRAAATAATTSATLPVTR